MAQTSRRPLPRYNSAHPILFSSLASSDPCFASVLSQNHDRMDFKNPVLLQQLTKSILVRDFGVTVELSDKRLCPPVPVRYNYVRWMQDLLDSTDRSYDDTYDPSREVTGLDVGTGASLIYPLLATASHPAWMMHATEIDSLSTTFALRNRDLNPELANRIRIHKLSSGDVLIPLDELGLTHVVFTMCNPPFYSTVKEMHESLAGKGKTLLPSAACTGAETEMVYEPDDPGGKRQGGDLGFVMRMIDESLVLRERVKWYSSMVGKLETLKTVVERLKEAGLNNWAVTCLIGGSGQGGQTRRWAVAWSFGDLRPRNVEFLAFDVHV